MRKFEQRFEGRDNAGLRARIRGAVLGHRCGNANAAAILALADVVALTAQGRATLRAVADDYRAAHGEFKYTCDCYDCCRGSLQALGALG